MKKELDDMLNRLNQWEAANKDADLTQMEEAIDAELAGIRQQLLEQMAREGRTRKPGWCVQIDQPMMKNGQKSERYEPKRR
ncbi:MAG: hypothetical protein H6657_22700 [Ardenticatenaceae bacterium]|nr:hypothetical protein [Ardenticatenaceae bacterium]